MARGKVMKMPGLPKAGTFTAKLQNPKTKKRAEMPKADKAHVDMFTANRRYAKSQNAHIKNKK